MKRFSLSLICVLCVLFCIQCAPAFALGDDPYEGWDESELLTDEQNTTTTAPTTTEPPVVYTTTTTTAPSTSEAKEIVAPIVQITRQTMSHKPKADELFSVVVQFQNYSRSITLMQGQAVFEPGDGLILAEKSDTKVVPTVAPNGIVRVELHLRTQKEYSVADVPVQVTYTYSYRTPDGIVSATAADKLMIALQSVPGSKESAAASATPNIIVSKYTYGGTIAAGDDFTLQLDFTNTSQKIPIENIMMAVSSGDGASITSASNTYFYPSLGAGQTMHQSIPMRVQNSADAQGVKVGIEFRYEYVDNQTRNNGNTSESLSIPIYVRDRFQITSPDTKLIGVQNEELCISIPYVNKGRSSVNNVHAQLIYDEKIASCEQPQLNLGNLESGKSGSIDFYITPQEAGDGSVKVLITYEDELQQEKTKEVRLDYTADAAFYMGDEEFNDDIPEEENSGSPLKTILWITIPSAAVIFLIVVLVVRHKRKKKKEDPSVTFDWNFTQAEEQKNEND